MKCKECDCCKLGYFKSKPNDYVCTGVKEPFVINDINEHCTEYRYKREATREDAIKYINAQLESGYLDLGRHDEMELRIVKEAMELLHTIDKFNEVALNAFNSTDELLKLLRD